jgi:hypothetical protein
MTIRSLTTTETTSVTMRAGVMSMPREAVRELVASAAYENVQK